jgi:hypothetical protein
MEKWNNIVNRTSEKKNLKVSRRDVNFQIRMYKFVFLPFYLWYTYRILGKWYLFQSVRGVVQVIAFYILPVWMICIYINYKITGRWAGRIIVDDEIKSCTNGKD